MLVSYNWLKEYINIDLPAKELADKLSMAGLVAANIKDAGNDSVIEFERLPNRPDWLNVIGIAREISAVCNVPKNIPKIEISEINKDVNKYIDVKIKNPELCNRYTARIIEDVQIGPSPDWIVDKLKKSGIRSINNVVDITNYVLLEYGQPLHAFDYDKINGKKIIIRNAKKEKISTLDGTSRELSDDMLVIADKKCPIAVAGVMGASGSEVTLNTTTILLESAYFNPKSIRNTSRTLNLISESSYRFERGADIDIVITASNRAAQLISEICSGKIYKGIVDCYPNKLHPITIEARASKINSILGANLPDETIINYLEKLDFDVTREENGIFLVYAPNFRREVLRQEDIAEEIARLYGYDNIKETLPLMQMQLFPENILDINITKVREYLIGSGLTEAINYSFISPLEQKENSIKLLHPISEAQSVLRQSLLPGLLRNFETNLNHNNFDFNFFEIGKIYYLSDNNIKEDVCVSAMSVDDFWTLKGILIGLLNFIGYEKRINFKKTDIYIDDIKIGFFKIDSDKKLNCFEIKLNEIINIKKNKKIFKQLNKYPASKRDLALVMPEETEYQEIIDFIYKIKMPFECNVSLFDIYRGDQVEKGKKSLAISLTFRSQEKTLRDEEVDVIFRTIINEFENKKGITLRK